MFIRQETGLKYRSHILYLFGLEHLSNGFKKIPGSRPLKVGNVCRVGCHRRERKLRKTVRVSGRVLTDSESEDVEWHAEQRYENLHCDEDDGMTDGRQNDDSRQDRMTQH
jgi:hypothetical protein